MADGRSKAYWRTWTLIALYLYDDRDRTLQNRRRDAALQQQALYKESSQPALLQVLPEAGTGCPVSTELDGRVRQSRDV